MRGKFSKVAAIGGLLLALFFQGMAQGDAFNKIEVGAERINRYLPYLYGKNIGVVANQTSRVGGVHLVDTLQARGCNLERIFSPEHGFRGTADAGETVQNGVDAQSGISIVSLYGSNKRFPADLLDGMDVLLFDLQDVGARFYTYISTLHYAMEACAAKGVQLIILDRPNPNGFYVDGPMNKLDEPSFIAMHPVPVVHGMTIAEYAQMLVGEGWIDGADALDLAVVPCFGYRHSSKYELPVPPSPNLRSQQAIYLYPSLCFFEGTTVSIGRGTSTPFEVVGAPYFSEDAPYEFTPKSSFGAKSPKWQDKVCHGYNLKDYAPFLWEQGQLNIFWLMDAYRQTPDDVKFWNAEFFDLLAGGPELREQIVAGKTEQEIRASWAPDLAAFAAIRRKYLLYPQ